MIAQQDNPADSLLSRLISAFPTRSARGERGAERSRCACAPRVGNQAQETDALRAPLSAALYEIMNYKTDGNNFHNGIIITCIKRRRTMSGKKSVAVMVLSSD